MIHETSLQIINIYSISSKNWDSELLSVQLFQMFLWSISICILGIKLYQNRFIVIFHDRCWKKKYNKKTNEKYHSVGTVSKSNRNFIERGKIDTPSTCTQGCSLSWHGTRLFTFLAWYKAVHFPDMVQGCSLSWHGTRLFTFLAWYKAVHFPGMVQAFQ